MRWNEKKLYGGRFWSHDMIIAQNLTIKSVLVLTGEGSESQTTRRYEWSKYEPTFIAKDCLDAVKKIIENETLT